MQLCAHFVGGEDIFLSLSLTISVFIVFFVFLLVTLYSVVVEREIGIDPQPMMGRYIVIGDDDDNWWRHVISGPPRDITIIL